jgi:uracil-DNA glycosylase
MNRGDSLRLRGAPVPACFPTSGPVDLLIYGEAPGPRGADQSGIPFWGDGAGIPLYRALVRATRAQVPETAWEPWDGARLRDAAIWPVLVGVALSNAFAACPTDDGHKFRTPKKGELNSAQNLTRLEAELETAAARGTNRVITLGRCAALTLGPLVEKRGWLLVPFPHPSSQGLLMSAPGKGRGLKLADLRAAWEDRLVAALA